MKGYTSTSSKVLLVIAIAMATTGCTGRQLYSLGQGWQANECQRIPDIEERKRCLESASRSYEEYEKESQAGRSSR